MRVQQLVLFISASVMGGLAAQPAVSQDYRGTQEQQMACTPDVWRLCSDQIPDVNRIVGCLRQNTLQLSAPCRAVFDSNNAVAQAPVQRGRRVPPPPRSVDGVDEQGSAAPPVFDERYRRP